MAANNITLELENKAILSLASYSELAAKANILDEFSAKAQQSVTIEIDDSYLRYPSLMPVTVDTSIEFPIAIKGAIAAGFVNGVKAADERTRDILMRWVIAGDRHFFNVRTNDLGHSGSDKDAYDLNNFEDWCMMVDTYKEVQNDDSGN